VGAKAGGVNMLRRYCRCLCFCVLTIAMFFTGSVLAQDAAHDVVITLECDAYKIAVTGDGLVVYEGKQSVRIVGKREKKIDPAAVQKLVQQFQDIHYFELEDEYLCTKGPDGNCWVWETDLPTTYTSLSLNGKTKKIKAYAGVPEELEKLERTIFEVTGSRQWAAIDAEGVREEVRRGWNVRSPEATSLLIVASFEGDAETVKALIDAGANVNANDGYEMPIQMARGAAVVRLLVAAGADVNGQVVDRNSDPALQNAARWGDAVTVRELLKNNAHIDGRAWDGSTALMRAAEAGRPEVVSTLLEAGASVRGTNQFGYDVMKCLDNGLTSQSNFVWGKKREEVEARFEKVREMLMKAGATI
jgi:hypothetical protein